MKTGLLLITHGNLGQEMLDTVKAILPACPLQTLAISAHANTDPEELLDTASRACDKLDQGAGVLVLTDLFGSTPSNVANRLVDRHRAMVISGANIPMLLRIMNYPDTDMEELAEKAAAGAHDGIMLTSRVSTAQDS
jgi:PTS system ascorbate-specific IIA component